MKKVLKTIALLGVALLILSGAFSCAGTTVTQEEHDALKAQLSDAEAKVAEAEAKIVELEAKLVDPKAELEKQQLKDEITSLKAEIEELGSEITELDKQNDILAQEKTSLETRYAELNAKYEELQETLAELSQPEIITEEQIENEILKLINQERVTAGVPEFIFGKTLYGQAKQNSRHMAESGKVEYNPVIFYQEVFWAAGYETVNTIVRGALLTWKINDYRFEHGALLAYNKYGAIGAYKSGEVIYITFMAASFP
jgi:DNA gyrase/topoisomerase IV subunit A